LGDARTKTSIISIRISTSHLLGIFNGVLQHCLPYSVGPGLAAGDRLGLDVGLAVGDRLRLAVGHSDFLPKSRSEELASPPHDPPISTSQLITQFPSLLTYH
jgi:hypothetical protein